MADFQDREERLDDLLSVGEATIAGAFLRAVREARRRLPLEEVRRLLFSGGTRAVLESYNRSLGRVLAAYQSHVLSSAESTVAEIAEQLGIQRSLDLSRSRLPSRLREDGRFVRAALVESQSRAVDAAYSAAVAAGADPAPGVRDALGLSAAQVVALLRYQRIAAAARREETDDGEELRPTPTQEAARSAGGYRLTLLGAAGASWGLSLAQMAQGIGVREAVEQAEEDGDIDRVTEEWLTARDERVRASHRAMHGQRRPAGEPFRSGDGNSLRYPGDPSAPASDRARCRCVVRTRATAATPLPLR